MTDADAIAHQHELLAIYRRNVHHLLTQAAMSGGEASASLPLMHDIRAQREHIRDCKAAQRQLGAVVADLPQEEPPMTAALPPTQAGRFLRLSPAAPLFYRQAVERLISEYERVFGGREAELAALDAFLAQDTCSRLLLLEPTGRGKTALLLHWLAQVEQRGQWAIVLVPISRRFETATAGATLPALAQMLAAVQDDQAQFATYTTELDHLRPLIVEYLRRDPPGDRRVVLVLDGIDEAVGWEVGKALFPPKVGARIKIIVSAREVAHRKLEDWLGQLGWRAAETTRPRLPLLAEAAVTDILQRMGNPLDALATQVNVRKEIVRVSEGDPLTIRYMVEALHDGQVKPEQLTRLLPGLEAFVRRWLEEIEREAAHDPALHAVLGLCAVALGPLTSEDILEAF